MNPHELDDYFEGDAEDDDYDPDQEEIDEDEDEMDIEADFEDAVEEALEDEDEEMPSIDLSELLNGGADGSSESDTLRLILSRLLRSGRRAAFADEDEDEEDEHWSRLPRNRDFQYSPRSEPHPDGIALQRSGDFGAVPKALMTKQPVQRTVSSRKRSLVPLLRDELSQDVVPNSAGTVVARYGSNVYAGQFSTDASFYYTCVQDFRLHIYNTKAPTLQNPHIDGDHVSTMKHNKSIRAVPGGWTITDSHLSPDNTLLAYAIMSPTVFLASTVPDDESEQRSLTFGQTRHDYGWNDRAGIWSCRFSADGKELVAGGSGKLMVYDLIADRCSVRLQAHRADVNSCCWADAGGNVLISASDDSFVKVWDRRSLGTSPKPAGVLIGHTEGITYVAPKGDGRYIISNGKDQTLKLWDLRKMAPFSKFWEVRGEEYGIPDFDYRRETYPKPIREDHPHDCSVMSYRGHRVLRTLIRCNFSPAETTGSRYLYSGSSDGMIHIWALDGTLVQKIDRKKVHDIGIDPSETEGPIPNPSTRRTAGYPLVVRDVAWHPQEPVLMSCSWAGPARRNSEVAKHEWKGLNKLGGRLEDFVEREQQETKERQARIPAPPSHGGWY
ncbi:hypothetical protein FRB91_011162 [Serendipita sp. 411]|nr:hypothetical protein FRC18_010036 [Serendipita sp. 400]KAG8857564.1 hypothetical protein FRB91_011162 [Serendipita sp. 411]